MVSERRGRLARIGVAAALILIIVAALMMLVASAGHAAENTTGHSNALAVPAEPIAPTDPATPTPVATPTATPGTGLTVEINGPDGAPSSAIVTLIGITLLSVAPALLLMMTSFTKIFVVLAMTRNALALPSIPPNQVLAGLALFLSLFIMAPVLTDINTDALQPYLNGTMTFDDAVTTGSEPLRTFMLAHTRQEDLALMVRASDQPNPANTAAVSLLTLIPAFMISELRAAFIIGFVIFIPFLVIDLVVSAALMSMGMMMLPPVMISLPFKILLFILVDGWGLIITTLVNSYRGG
ncbi:flagellar type III secretion system pore protein FliP [Cryobacterium arcticum]|uniref:Flagellar biosynthetic protein FliP n=1 Tax=Cryobacterium arcticum TaxID=670052 RepID=A0A1B1BJ04_9MICO|nr:flagellar type III secretion system pore protein FliP [Cryobacterium arcticum]ANP72486.1 flagellar biosynthesis protein FliP [Cryobacterium arcticum]